MSLNIALSSPFGIVSVANRAFSLERFQCIEGRSATRGFYPAAVSSANHGIRGTSAPGLPKGTRPLRLPRRASRRRAPSGGGAMHIANAGLRREPGATNNNGDGNKHPDGHAKVDSPTMGRAEGRDKPIRGADDNRTEYNRTEDNRTINVRTGGRVLTPEEHWRRYRPQLATRYGHWRFWLPAQGREAKLSLELLREITPAEVESGAEEYVLRLTLSLSPPAQHEQFKRWRDLPSNVAEGAWPFSCGAHTTGAVQARATSQPSTSTGKRTCEPRWQKAHGCPPVKQLGDYPSPSPHPSLSTHGYPPISFPSPLSLHPLSFTLTLSFAPSPHSTSSSTGRGTSQPRWQRARGPFNMHAPAMPAASRCPMASTATPIHFLLPRDPSAQHEQFKRKGDFPAKVAEGAWPFSCARASHANGIALPYGIYSHGARVLCAGGDEEREGGEAGEGDEVNGGGAVVMAQLQRDDKGRGQGNMGGGSVRRAVLLTANVCFMDGPSAQLNVAFSEASLSLRQDDTVLPTDMHNKSHTSGSAASYQATDGTTSPSSQSLHDTWASPHWKTPLPTHLPASLPSLPPKPLYGVPHYIYADLYATPLPEHPNKRLETQNMEVFSGYLAGIPEAQQNKYGVWALPRGVVVAMPSPLEPMLSREGGGEGEEFWLVVTYVRGGGEGVQGGGGDGIREEERGGEELGVGEGEEDLRDGLEDTGYMAEGEWKVQQVVIAYDAQGQFDYVKHTRFM
ncbi:unnamed protein product [Closterium sp. NIES-64]|nr:unnamed protein product [Closterium sp. NIES-64]